MRSVLLLMIRGYQWLVRPFLRPSCRFYPSCSCYAHEAVVRHGAWKGSRMTLSRLARCHPWNPGGYDPVDAPADKSATQPATPERRLNQLNQF